MTTYDGHRAGFVPGVGPKHRIANISLAEYDKRFVTHRLNVLGSVAKVGTHHEAQLVLPKRQTWTLQEYARRKANAELGNRLARINESEGFFTKEHRQHMETIASREKYIGNPGIHT
jgi:hypothetical protein